MYKSLYLISFKILLIYLIFFWIFYWAKSFSGKCSYASDINTCEKANDWWEPLAIEEFLCIQSESTEDIAYQIILDDKFSEIDEDIEEYLGLLEKNKSYFFWKDSSSNFLEGINEIWENFWKFWYYWEQYKNLCSVWTNDWSENKNSILSETLKCFWWWGWFNSSKGFFRYSECMWLAEEKLEIYEDVAFDILTLNKHYVRNDEKKLFIQDERDKYDKLIEIFMVNIWYIERIWKKWPSVTPIAN